MKGFKIRGYRKKSERVETSQVQHASKPILISDAADSETSTLTNSSLSFSSVDSFDSPKASHCKGLNFLPSGLTELQIESLDDDQHVRKSSSTSATPTKAQQDEMARTERMIHRIQGAEKVLRMKVLDFEIPTLHDSTFESKRQRLLAFKELRQTCRVL